MNSKQLLSLLKCDERTTDRPELGDVCSFKSICRYVDLLCCRLLLTARKLVAVVRSIVKRRLGPSQQRQRRGWWSGDRWRPAALVWHVRPAVIRVAFDLARWRLVAGRRPGAARMHCPLLIVVYTQYTDVIQK